MMKFLSFILLLLLHKSTSKSLIDYRLSSPTDEHVKECSEPGLFCETCSNLVVCVKDNSNDTWTKDVIESCKSPAVCVGGSCVNKTSDPFCSGLADLDFPCRKSGIFPDPFYCNKYVMCVEGRDGLRPYVNECEEGFKYNIVTALCDIKLKTGECEADLYPVPLCEKVGQSGALPGKPAAYYMCEKYSYTHDVLYPVLNVCPGAQVYEDYQCGVVTTPHTTEWTTFSTTEETTSEEPSPTTRVTEETTVQTTTNSWWTTTDTWWTTTDRWWTTATTDRWWTTQTTTTPYPITMTTTSGWWSTTRWWTSTWWSTERTTTPAPGEEVKQCSKSGLFCESCSHLVVCIKNDDDVWYKEPVETCQSPKRCVRGTCTSDFSDPFCSGTADLQFPCRKPGIFPHPFYCNKYVLCVGTGTNLTPYINNCEKGFKFNVVSALCDIELDYGECEDGVYPLPVCEQVGQSGPLPGKNAQYYICEKYSEIENVLYPVMNVCPGGRVYENYECREE